MFTPQLSHVALCLLAVPGAVTGMGLHGFSLREDMLLAKELGLDPLLILNDRATFRDMVADSVSNSTQAEYITMPIDHWNLSAGTYQNRYWVDEKHYKPGGPVFVYDAGEANAEFFVTTQIENETSFFQEYLRDFNGMGILWEHRYYGDSLPFPVSRDTPPEHWQFLTVEQALADIPYFAARFSREGCSSVDLRPQSTPWIMLGGSYPGARAAFTRDQYPETIFASYASSAPLQAQINLSEYYNQVYRSMMAHGLGNCISDMQATLAYIDDQLANNETSAAMKQLFFGEGAEINSNGAFTSALAGVYGGFQSFGLGPSQGGIQDFCNYFEADPTNSSRIAPNGLASTYGPKFLAERFSAWPIFILLVNANFETNCRGLNSSIPTSCVLGRPIASPTAISWAWQYCSQWGFYQVDNTGPWSLLSRYQTVEYFQTVCNEHFSEAVEKGYLPPHPRTGELNSQTGGWTVRPSNVYWTTGQYDPWQPLQPFSKEAWAPPVSYSTEIPECYEVQADHIFGYVMEGAEHCFDFRMDFPPGAIARGHFKDALHKWLPCF